MSAPIATSEKTTYIPHMADHAYALAAVMRNMGMRAEVLPVSNEESMTIGLDLCKGRECLPCFLTTGDLIRRSRQPGFDPAKAVFLMPGSTGPCRFGQYSLLQREILARHDLGEVAISSPMITNSYDGLGENPEELRKRFWEGAVAVDILLSLLHEHRPYELEPGAAEAAYRASLAAVLAAIEEDGRFSAVLDAFDVAAGAFGRIPVDRSVPRPLIAMIGEVFVRLNAYSNRDLILQIEAAGGRVALAGFAEWQYTSHWYVIERHRLRRERLDQLKAIVTQAWMRHREHQLHAKVAHLRTEACEPKAAHSAAALRPYFDPALEGEAIPTLWRAIESAQRGASGILNVLPFSCMPGIIVSAMAPRLRRDLDWIPWLDLSFDGQETTNIRTRLEAFMHQVMQFQRQQGRKGSHGRPVERAEDPRLRPVASRARPSASVGPPPA